MKHRRKSTDPGLITGLAGALLLHGAWLLLPFPELNPRDGAPLASLYLLSESRAWVWTPTLFSLPTRYGFSGAMERDSALVEPPLESPLDLSVSYWDDTDTERPLPELPPPADTPSFALLTPIPSESPPAAQAPAYRWNLIFPDLTPAPRSGFRPPHIPALNRTLQVEGFLSFDEFGMVSEALLSQNSLPDAERREILRSLRGYRIPRGQEPARHFFRLAHLPESPAE